MGENRRYDRSGPLDAATEAEVRALRVIAGLVEGGTRLITDRAVAGQLGEVLRTAATELASGRALPIPVRRAVRHLADGIRAALDPRPGARRTAGSGSTVHRTEPGLAADCPGSITRDED